MLVIGMKAAHQKLADKHGVSVSQIEKEIAIGEKEELEHTSDKLEAHKIAMDHIKEDPNYYKKLSGAGLVEKAKEDKVAVVMREFKEGTLTSHGKPVTDRQQALAIAMSEAGLSKAVKDLNYWKKKLMAALSGEKMSKSMFVSKGRGMAVGTIREWGGKKYKKLSSGKWMRTFTGTGDRGEKQAIRNVMKKIQSASSMEDLSKIVSENMQRFKDDSGKTLPIVKEFMSAARGTESGEKESKQKKPVDDLGPDIDFDIPAGRVDKLLNDVKTVMIYENLPFDVPKGSIVMNAPRPLNGETVPEGDFIHGIYYAVFDTNDPMVEHMITRNKKLDAWLIVQGDKDKAKKEVEKNLIKEYGDEYKELPQSDKDPIIADEIDNLRAKQYGEVKHLLKNEQPTKQKIVVKKEDPLFKNEAVKDIAKKMDMSMDEIIKIVNDFKKDNPRKKINIDTVYTEIARVKGVEAEGIKGEIKEAKKKIAVKKPQSREQKKKQTAKDVKDILSVYRSGWGVNQEFFDKYDSLTKKDKKMLEDTHSVRPYSIDEMRGEFNKNNMKKSRLFIRKAIDSIKNMKNIASPPAEYDRKYKLQDRLKWHGLDIAIENKKGSYRTGKDSNGKEWKTKMGFDYGRIGGSKAVDGEGVDIFVGPDDLSDMVYVIHQQDPFKGVYDEDKCFINMPSREATIEGYLSQYNRPDFLGPISEFTIPEFKQALKDKKGSMLYKSPIEYNADEMRKRRIVIKKK